MGSIFSTRGELGRSAYFVIAIPALLCQHAFALACLAVGGGDFSGAMSWYFALNPLRVLLDYNDSLGLLAGMGVLLLAGWILTAASFRRARDAGLPFSIAYLAIVPVLQGPLIIFLALFPTSAKRVETQAAPASNKEAQARPILLGMLAGMAISVATAALATLVFGSYGYTLFLVTPIVVGGVAAYVANSSGDTSDIRTGKAVMGALGLGALGIMGVAVEGAICLVMASPLIILLGMVGGAIGQILAEQRGRRTTLTSLAVLPFLFLGETVFPPKSEFVSVESIVIAANPDQVWRSITEMGEIAEPPAIPFGWLAYPVSGQIDGEGAGAVRRGVFSTGIAYERVTVWEPGQRLWFDVLSNPPALRELSPYGEIRTPHMAGYFTTRYARFNITPVGNGRTKLSLETLHTLKLEPALYWTPIAQWAVHENKTRVLTHFAQQAETAARKGLQEGTDT